MPRKLFPESPDMVGLRSFAEGEDRNDPPVFVGRQGLIASIRHALQDKIHRWRSGENNPWKGATWLVQGAPGAGKTALLSHLAQTLPVIVSAPGGDRREPPSDSLQVVQLSAKHIEDISGTHIHLAEALQAGAGKKLSQRAGRTWEGGAGAVLRGSFTRSVEEPVLRWYDLTRIVREQPATVRPVLLTIDEIQNVKGGPEGPAATLLQLLHTNEDALPILPVYGGLAWSRAHLFELEVSRFSNNDRVRSLSSLSGDDCRQAVAGFLQRYRVVAGEEETRTWSQDIAEACQGWPQHLQVCLQGLARGLINNRVEGVLARIDSARVWDWTQKQRESYYTERLSHPVLQHRPALAAALVAKMATGGRWEVPDLGLAAETIAKQMGAQHPRYQLPAMTSGERFVEKMIRAGLLHKEQDETLAIPIPSFAAFLTGRYPLPKEEGQHDRIKTR